MSHLILSHLSKNNNRPEIVQQLFNTHAGTTKMIVASRYKETSVYQINGISTRVVDTSKPMKQKLEQLSLF
jgi:hypothetical protein